jgi:hypothetical protein
LPREIEVHCGVHRAAMGIDKIKSFRRFGEGAFDSPSPTIRLTSTGHTRLRFRDEKAERFQSELQ